MKSYKDQFQARPNHIAEEDTILSAIEPWMVSKAIWNVIYASKIDRAFTPNQSRTYYKFLMDQVSKMDAEQ